VNKIDLELRPQDGRQVLTRYETPLGLWLLDRWFRIPDLIFDRIEWWLPRTGPITRVPCQLYARWFPELIVRRTWVDYDVIERPRAGEEAP
jgi:hypothetical protein